MRVPLLLLVIVLAVTGAVDFYIWRQTKRRCVNPLWSKIQLWTSIVFAAVMITGVVLPARQGENKELLCKMWLLFGYMTVFLPKVVGVLFDILASIPLLFKKRRLKPLTIAGIVLAAVLFVAMWWGALVNRYRTQQTEIEIVIPDLPDEFDGFRIAQFSDLHTGTYANDTTFVSHLTDELNSVGADAIVFTGDIVNRQSKELEPFTEVLSRLSAPAGTFAILGNHDYGDYMNWSSPEEKKQNMELLYDLYRETGMRLLLNETVWLRRGNDSIALIGVENIGDHPFPVYGSLVKAYPDLGDKNSKILLTHNPAHWTDSIANNNDINVDLTLSGHTHAMQIEVMGLSPAVFRYPTWGGLYEDDDSAHKLYVNIGAGTVGFPMRLGATPEITVLTLRKAPSTKK